MSHLRVGTRGSLLARAQTTQVLNQIQALSPTMTWSEHLVKTEGDLTDQPLATLTTPGIFVSALRDELLNGSVDVIVHSMKDLPANPHPGITLAAIPLREDPRDTLISAVAESFEALPRGARVGTSSPRREASVRRLRPDLVVEPIRGNITTRIEKVTRGDFDATILAKAGLVRAGLTSAIRQELDMKEFLPAPRQGALAIECRSSDPDTIKLVGLVDDETSRITALAEQAVLVGLQAGCHVAIGAHASLTAGILDVHAELAISSTGQAVTASKQTLVNGNAHDQAETLGLLVAEELMKSPLSQEALRA